MTVENTRIATEAGEVGEAGSATGKPVSSRRAFLGGTTAAVAAGGVLAAMPHLTSSDPDLRRILAESEGLEHISLDDPLIVHVSDLETGEISLYVGERHVVVHDKDLATRLAAATVAKD